MFLKFAVLLVLGVALNGASADDPERVVGGTNATLGEFPYQVSLQDYDGHFCGGTLISNQHVLTAAHCVTALADMPSGFKVLTGTVKRSSGGQIHEVKSVTIHEKYREGPLYSWENDIALITLKAPIKVNAYQKPIQIATSDPPVNATVILSGWGRLYHMGPIPDHLQKAAVRVISNKQCQSVHKNMHIYNTHICTLYKYGIGVCKGDSGGPIVYNGKVVGVVSWIIPCAVGAPDVYTRVSQYRDFIYKAAGFTF